jgi:hypothetical protein
MELDAGVLVLVVLAAAALVVVRPAWRFARYPVTAVHEFGHLVVALAVGGRGARIRLRADTSGLTTWRTTRNGRFRSGLIALAGPGTPPLVGAACAAALVGGQATLGLLGLAVLVGIVSVVVRNLWGVLVCIALAALCWLAWRQGAVATEVLLVVTATVLCLGGLRAVAEELTSLQPGGTSDTQVAAAALWLPARVWGAGLLAWALAGAVWAAWRITTVV